MSYRPETAKLYIRDIVKNREGGLRRLRFGSVIKIRDSNRKWIVQKNLKKKRVLVVSDIRTGLTLPEKYEDVEEVVV